eukprot:EG_transcript_29843
MCDSLRSFLVTNAIQHSPVVEVYTFLEAALLHAGVPFRTLRELVAGAGPPLAEALTAVKCGRVPRDREALRRLAARLRAGDFAEAGAPPLARGSPDGPAVETTELRHRSGRHP